MTHMLSQHDENFSGHREYKYPRWQADIPFITAKACTLDNELPAILKFLNHGKHPNGHTSEELDCLHKQAHNFFAHDNQLW